jgi:hypothetical protein
MSASPIPPGRRKRWPQIAGTVLVSIVVLYALAFAGFYYAMCQPPATFGTLMKHTGPAPFLLFPFESMWKSARGGHVQAGDEAPDFTLPRLDHSGAVTLSSFRGVQPVALIFGSYT